MPNPTPGTVIPVGTLVSPGGPQGVGGPIGPAGVQGPIGPAIASSFVLQTASYTLTPGDSGKYFICSGGNLNITLPVAAAGLCYYIRNDMGITGTTGIVTVLAQSGGPLIDGAGSLSLLAQQEILVITDGTNWRSFGRRRQTVLGTQDLSNAAQGIILLPPGYRYYELSFEAIQAASGNQILFSRVSVNYGSTWQTDSNYLTGLLYTSPPNTAPTATAAWTTAGAAYGNWMCAPLQAGNQAGCSFVKLWPGSASYCPHWSWYSWAYNNTDGMIRTYQGNTLYNSQAPVNGFMYFMSSGNIVTSQLTVIGVS